MLLVWESTLAHNNVSLFILQKMLYISSISFYLMSLMASDCMAGRHFPHTIPNNLTTLCCVFLFLFPYSFWSSVNKLVKDYFPSIVDISVLLKQYLLMTFVNIGNSVTGIDLVFTNFTIPCGCLKFASTWVIIDSLNSVDWDFSLLSVGNVNTLKLSSPPAK